MWLLYAILFILLKKTLFLDLKSHFLKALNEQRENVLIAFGKRNRLHVENWISSKACKRHCLPHFVIFENLSFTSHISKRKLSLFSKKVPVIRRANSTSTEKEWRRLNVYARIICQICGGLALVEKFEQSQ